MGLLGLCLNYIQGGLCLLDGRPCLLGARGQEALNQDRQCSRHGSFDVWRTREGLILISDLAGPCEGAVDCYGLGISLQEATEAAKREAQSLSAKTVTTERKCAKCGERFWPRGDLTKTITPSRASGYFCASCLKLASEAELHEYWKEIGSTSDMSQIDLNEWCG